MSDIAAYCSGVLAAKIFVTQFIQGGKNFAVGARAPEDGNVVPAAGPQNFGMSRDDVKEDAKLSAARWNKIMINDTENLPLGLILTW
eukprot:CAMPEP_0169062886 /NCGR_PEP_ID=MMETSP1015-20121227/953_1 /TAXON_ID=342587 /ORGANISM="Karlodinium micrum, Strain CCMP2283" /LENGTH=86 /DNA_ID=CAMNT_0009121111 /DNA_START=49 /DNA_END=306 /DNA_ORIENTATION=-